VSPRGACLPICLPIRSAAPGSARTSVDWIAAHTVWVDPVRMSMAWKKFGKNTVALLSAEAGVHPAIGASQTLSGSCPPEATNSCPVGRPRRPDPQGPRPAHPQAGCQRPRPVVETFPSAGRSQPDAPQLHRQVWVALAVRPPRLLARWAVTTDGFGPAASTDTSSQAESIGRAD
jgi:hypothetical protein